jgi:hypothetical protein
MRRLYLNALKGTFVISAVLFSISTLADGWNPFSRAPNRDSIEFTRHNLTLSYNSQAGGVGNTMDLFRNQYVEICVYCHTPHGANSQIDAPLWNRTINTGEYQIYDKPRTLNRPIGQPGPNSLTCLSCHDGTISIDSIINMPGSGLYSKAQETAMNTGFLSQWGARAGIAASNHFAMGPDQSGEFCTVCHNDGQQQNAMSDFTVFVIGTDLRNDHPIGIQYPEGPYGKDIGVDFYEPYKAFSNATGASMWFHDTNGNTYPDKQEPRMYNTGENFEVECASCHDPHGVPTNGSGSEFIPSFLRVSNGNANTGDTNASGLCLTCHIK